MREKINKWGQFKNNSRDYWRMGQNSGSNRRNCGRH